MDRGAALLILAAIGAVAVVVNVMQKPPRHRIRRKADPVNKAEKRQFTLILGAVVLLFGIPLFLHYVLGWRV